MGFYILDGYCISHLEGLGHQLTTCLGRRCYRRATRAVL